MRTDLRLTSSNRVAARAGSLLAVLVATALLIAIGFSCTAPSPVVLDTHTWTTRSTTVSEEFHTLPVSGAARQFLLHEPLGIAEGERLPVVIFLHGLGVSSGEIANWMDSRANVVERHIITVFPQGYGNSWNLGSCCPPTSSAGVDDIAFLDALTGYLAGRPDVDPNGMSLGGASLGGMMSYRYACGHSARLSGLVSVAGTHLGTCGPSSSLPTLQIHSIADEVVAYDGHPTATEVALGLNFPPVVPTLAAWASSCGTCPDGPTSSQHVLSDLVTVTLWDCGGTTTRLETLAWGGHTSAVIGDYVVADQVFGFLVGPVSAPT